MAISEKDRKRLWAKSGNRCAICKQELVKPNADNLDYNIGEECHIVSGKPSGPRHEDGWSDYDIYENLILLCRNHHKTIDDVNNISQYPKEKLLEIKSKHELWVKEKLSFNKDSDILPLISTGAELASIISGIYGVERSNDPITNKENAEYIGGIWQTIQDAGDIYSELEPCDQINIDFELQKLLEGMPPKGFVFYGKRITKLMKYPDGTTEKWPVAKLYIRNLNREEK